LPDHSGLLQRQESGAVLKILAAGRTIVERGKKGSDFFHQFLSEP
jgi:hypothetical protein